MTYVVNKSMVSTKTLSDFGKLLVSDSLHLKVG